MSERYDVSDIIYYDVLLEIERRKKAEYELLMECRKHDPTITLKQVRAEIAKLYDEATVVDSMAIGTRKAEAEEAVFVDFPNRNMNGGHSRKK